MARKVLVSLTFSPSPTSQERNPNYSPSSFVDKPTCDAKVEASPPLTGTVAVTDYTVAADLQDLDEKIKSMMEVGEKHINSGRQKQKSRICKVCGKEGQMGDIQRHIESHHITGVSHTCNICGKISRSRNALRKHKSKEH